MSSLNGASAGAAASRTNTWFCGSVLRRNREHQVLAVIRHADAEVPVRMIGPAVDELIVFLLRAQLVEVDHLVEGRCLVLLARLAARDSACSRSRVPSLFQSTSANRDHFRWSLELLAGFDVEHVNLLPVAAGFGARVGQVAAVLRDADSRRARPCRPSTTCWGRSARGLRPCTNRPRTAPPDSAGRRSWSRSTCRPSAIGGE